MAPQLRPAGLISALVALLALGLAGVSAEGPWMPADTCGRQKAVTSLYLGKCGNPDDVTVLNGKQYRKVCFAWPGQCCTTDQCESKFCRVLRPVICVSAALCSCSPAPPNWLVWRARALT